MLNPYCRDSVKLSFRVIAALCLIVPVVVHAAPPSGATDWPSYRGPNGDGTSTATDVFNPSGFSLNVGWKHELGSGYSAVVVAKQTVVTCFSDGTSDVMGAFSEESGSELWRYKMGPTNVGHDGSHTGPIATPAIADGRVFGMSARGKLFALKLDSGKEIWSSDLVKDHGAVKPHYGFASSPVVVDGVLIVQIGAEDGAVAGFDPATGKRLWLSGNDKISYQSPIPWTMHGQRLVVAVGDKRVFGIVPKTGEVLWKYAHNGAGPKGSGSMTAVPADGTKILLANKDETSVLLKLDGAKGGVRGIEEWTKKTIRNSYVVPVFHQGYFYAYATRFLTCVNASTGEMVWRSRQPGDGFITIVDDHLVILTKKGSLHVAKASPEGYEELAELPLFSNVAWSAAGFAGHSIFARSLDEIARVDIRAAVKGAIAGARKSVGGAKFERFLSEVGSASDKKSVVDRFMSANTFPMIEGDEIIHFVYRGQADDLAMGSDIFGARQDYPMSRVAGTDVFYHTHRLEPDARVNYLFIKDYKEILDPLNSRKTDTIIYKKEMEMSFRGGAMDMSWVAMPRWKAPTYLGEAPAAKRGSLEKHEIESKSMEKTISIQVYLPAGYASGTQRYPVAYVHDGDAAIKRGKYPNALDNLIGKTVAPVILVFINAESRGLQDAYVEAFATELIPFVDKNYRTIAKASARACTGTGFAAVNAMLCAFSHPDLVGNVATQSMFSFDNGARARLEALYSEVSPSAMRVYQDWGKYDLRNPHEAWDMARLNRETSALLRAKGFAPMGGEIHDGTGWSSWRNQTGAVFQAMFPMKATGGARKRASVPANIMPEEARKFLDSEGGWIYIDVRTVGEFADGHVPGSLNIPVMFRGGGGMAANQDFLAIVERHLAKDASIILGCRSGHRSVRAQKIMQKAGYATLTNMMGGWNGGSDASGAAVKGWSKLGYPAEQGEGGDKSYASLSAKVAP